MWYLELIFCYVQFTFRNVVFTILWELHCCRNLNLKWTTKWLIFSIHVWTNMFILIWFISIFQRTINKLRKHEERRGWQNTDFNFYNINQFIFPYRLSYKTDRKMCADLLHATRTNFLQEMTKLFLVNNYTYKVFKCQTSRARAKLEVDCITRTHK